MKFVAFDGGINWAWYMIGEIEGDAARVDAYYRLHRFNPEQGANDHPETNCVLERKTEDKDRNLLTIVLRMNGEKDRTEYRVSNSKYIFDY